jgi:hypothetical protein
MVLMKILVRLSNLSIVLFIFCSLANAQGTAQQHKLGDLS